MNGQARARLRAAIWLSQLLIAAALLWLGGFLWYAAKLPREVADPLSETDGIVVLTGGAERLEAGLDLLAAGKAKKLLISGVYPATNRDQLQRLSRREPEVFACCVELGKDAADTLGNAVETTRWARREGITSLRVVTASYHMPRAMAELNRAMPEVDLVPNPVFPATVKLDNWWAWPGTTLLMAAEFNKYLVSLARARLRLEANRAERP